jgi:signal transduction histidine kinase/CheY-like chemotaxis protein
MRYSIRRFFTPPVFPEDEEMTRVSRVLYTLFVAESVVITIGIATILFLFVNKVGTSLLLVLLLGRLLTARALAQRGRVRQASLLWLAGIWLMTGLTVLLTGRIGTTMVAFHLAIAVITGILLGKQSAIMIATLSSLLFLGLAILETTGYHLAQYMPATPLTQWFALVMAIIFTLFPLSLNIQGLVDALDRVRKSEQRYATLADELIAERSMLARRVAERTTELSQANANLEQAVRAKDEFLANMSHELRTPLNAILGISEGLLEQYRGPLNDRQQEMIGLIETSGQHLLALINDILDLSKVESGQMLLEREPAQISQVCESSLLFVKEQAIKKRIQISFQLNDHLAIADVDSKRLKQILVNLLSNAVKFTEEGGHVSLAVTVDAGAGVISYAVEDTGIGIASEDLARLFQPFVQVDASLSRRHSGTGLGLSLVRRLAEIHGGGVTVESEVGKGSRFTVTLPYSPANISSGQTPAVPTGMRPAFVIAGSASQPPSETPITPFEIKPAPIAITVLIVEDNEFNIVAVGDYLEAMGYRLTVAHNGREAIKRAGEVHPDVILMDIQMAEMDGLEAILRLRALPEFAHTPIIALTALAMPGDRERCLAAGADEYLTKPVNLKGLVATIQQLLP